MAGGATPEHSQQKGSKQRRIDKGKEQLEEVHNVVELGCNIGSSQTNSDAEDRSHPSHPEIVLVRAAWANVTLINVVGPDRIKGRDISGHPGHERGHQGSQSQ